MTYEVIRPMLFLRNGQSKDKIEIHVGVVVRSIPTTSLPSEHRAPCRKMLQRHRRENSTKRMIFFMFEGVPRSAVVGHDVRAKR